MKIAIFDSGVGGLASLARLERLQIADELFYYADLKNLPFGEKSAKELDYIINKDVDEILKIQPDYLVIACNTACSALHKEHFNNPAILKISTLTQQVIDKASFNTLFLCTKATLASNLYKLNSNCTSTSASNLVMSAQNAEFELAKRQILELKANFALVQNVIAGCTHFGILKPEFIASGLNLLDPVDLLASNFEFLPANKSSVIHFNEELMQRYYKEHKCRL